MSLRSRPFRYMRMWRSPRRKRSPVALQLQHPRSTTSRWARPLCYFLAPSRWTPSGTSSRIGHFTCTWRQ
eukprot:2199220-Pyramimonas_sp.AAC.1